MLRIGCGDITMDEANKKFTLAGKSIVKEILFPWMVPPRNIYDGQIPTVDATIAGEFSRRYGMGRQIQNHEGAYQCEYPADAKKARSLGQKVSDSAVQSICF